MTSKRKKLIFWSQKHRQRDSLGEQHGQHHRIGLFWQVVKEQYAVGWVVRNLKTNRTGQQKNDESIIIIIIIIILLLLTCTTVWFTGTAEACKRQTENQVITQLLDHFSKKWGTLSLKRMHTQAHTYRPTAPAGFFAAPGCDSRVFFLSFFFFSLSPYEPLDFEMTSESVLAYCILCSPGKRAIIYSTTTML